MLEETEKSKPDTLKPRLLYLHKHPVLDCFKGVLKTFDWHKCKPYTDVRKNGGKIQTKKLKNGSVRFRDLPPRRASIRKERELSLTCLTRALLKYANFDYRATFLFEVDRSIEQIAKELGVLREYKKGYDSACIEESKYRHGRKSCDGLRGALDDLEASKMVLVVREYDKNASQYKISRLFLRPDFFKAFGISMDVVKKLMERQKSNTRAC